MAKASKSGLILPNTKVKTKITPKEGKGSPKKTPNKFAFSKAVNIAGKKVTP